MEKKLYVGNLPYDIKESELETLFTQAGQVEEVAIITDRYSGRSKGFGFVTMAAEEGAKKAIELFNGKEVKGRNIVVNEARPARPREDRRSSFGR